MSIICRFVLFLAVSFSAYGQCAGCGSGGGGSSIIYQANCTNLLQSGTNPVTFALNTGVAQTISRGQSQCDSYLTDSGTSSTTAYVATITGGCLALASLTNGMTLRYMVPTGASCTGSGLTLNANGTAYSVYQIGGTPGSPINPATSQCAAGTQMEFEYVAGGTNYYVITWPQAAPSLASYALLSANNTFTGNQQIISDGTTGSIFLGNPNPYFGMTGNGSTGFTDIYSYNGIRVYSHGDTGSQVAWLGNAAGGGSSDLTSEFFASIALLPQNTLPTCSTSSLAWRATVTNATTPVVGVALTQGGSTFANVHCSLTTGTWIVDGI